MTVERTTIVESRSWISLRASVARWHCAYGSAWKSLAALRFTARGKPYGSAWRAPRSAAWRLIGKIFHSLLTTTNCETQTCT